MSKHPICLGCFRHGISMTDDPPREPGWPPETCTICSRATNYGIYVDGPTLRVATRRIEEKA